MRIIRIGVACVFAWAALEELGFAAIAIEIPEYTAPDIGSYLPAQVPNAFVAVVGLAMDYRSYEPASSLGTSFGLNLGVDATVVKPPTQLSDSLSLIPGVDGKELVKTVPFFPSARVHIQKGLSDRVEVGFSFMPPIQSIPYVGKSSFYGGEMKIVLSKPENSEEGLVWALRGAYSVNHLDFTYQGYDFSTKTFTVSPQLLVSKPLQFAEPYVGVGYQYSYGTFKLSVPVPNLPAPSFVFPPLSYVAEGRADNASFFGGLAMKFLSPGLRLAIEGAYGLSGMTYLGLKIGVGF